MDFVLLSQFCYYKCGCYAARVRRRRATGAGDALREAAAPLLGGRGGRRGLGALLPVLLCVALAAAVEAGPRARGGPGPGAAAFCGAARRPGWASQVGVALGWVSAACYAGSRLSQLARNAARRSAAGLAPGMFALALAGNGFYASSVLLRARTPADVARAAPWLAGSLGVMCLDAVLLAQARAASRDAGSVQHAPLLPPDGDDEDDTAGTAAERSDGGEGAGPACAPPEQPS